MSQYGNYKCQEFEEYCKKKTKRKKVAKWVGGATLIILLFGIIFLNGCRIQQIPVESKTEIRYVDSVVLKDSVSFIAFCT